MKYLVGLLVALATVLFLVAAAEAGCNGSCSQAVVVEQVYAAPLVQRVVVPQAIVEQVQYYVQPQAVVQRQAIVQQVVAQPVIQKQVVRQRVRQPVLRSRSVQRIRVQAVQSY